MPLPDRLARLNRHVANPIMRTFAGRLPPFAIVVHRGRRSGKVYQTPVWAFRAGEGFVIALTYGADRDWVKNVVAAGGCTFVRSGRRISLADPRVVDGDAGLRLIPALLRPALRLLGVTEFLRLDPINRPFHGATERDGGAG